MKMKHLRFRQINLDFHTSPDIERIGAAFDKREWQETLRTAHVDSIHCFAKCHHGLSYHPTRVGKMHPHLRFDLLRAQMEACREIDVKTPVYLSAGLDNVITEAQPGWREITPEGGLAGFSTSPLKPGFHKLCFHTPYLDYLCRQIEEVVTLFPESDGMVLDIVAQGECCCRWCLEVMAKNGLDAEKSTDRQRCAELALHRYYQATNAAARIHNPDFPVFHNSGHVTRGRRDWIGYQSHLELESLPTGGWGYDHFPESATYAAQTGRDYLGMTGKFHTTWGEFGGFKHPHALRYECAAMIAFGAKCAIGDQLHPEGRLDRSTYAMIGAAFAEVKAKEAWCDNSVAVVDIAVLSSESENPSTARNNMPDTGASRMLLEGHHLFAIIDREIDFNSFRLLILPDDIAIDAVLKKKIDAYLEQGGKLLLTGRSGLKEDGSGFAFDLGATYEGPSPYEPDYLLPTPEFQASFVQSPMVMYGRSQRIKTTTGQSLGQIFDPYFNRTFRHFCSHQHTPHRPEPSGYDAGVRHGNLVYLAHPVFALYRTHGAVALKEFVLRVIDSLLGERTVRTSLPSAGRVTLRHQPGERRQIVHLLYANKVVRGGKINCGGSASSDFILEIIEDLDPARDTIIQVRPGTEIAKVTLEPQGKEISFKERDGIVTLELASFICHQMIVLHEA